MADDIRGPAFTLDEGDDEVLRRVRATLAPLPAADPMAVARVLAAVHGRAPSPWSRWSRALGTLRRPGLSLVGGTTLLAAAVVGIVMTRDSAPTNVSAGTESAAVSTLPPHNPLERPREDTTRIPPFAGRFPDPMPVDLSRAVTTALGPEAAVPVQFVFDASTATSVSLVGDFNDWSAEATPMQQLPGSGVWTATLAITPGRHVYAFIVDGKTWTPDPRAPRAADSDFGKPGSVLLVMPR